MCWFIAIDIYFGPRSFQFQFRFIVVRVRLRMAVPYTAGATMRLLVFSLVLMSFHVSALQLRGAWEPGGMIVGQAEPDARVYLGKRRLALSPEGRFVFGLDRDVKGTVQLKVVRGNEEQVFDYPVAARKYDIQRVDGVPEGTVNPPPEVLERIGREAALVAAARKGVDRREDFLQGFVKPLEGPITGVYGSQRVYNGVPKNPHYGLDIARPTGTLVQAPAPGIVKLVHPDMYFSGGTLIIDHGYGISSTFIHLSEILVARGARVETGQDVARVGASGRATGPHLDWRINWFNVRLDPALALKHFPGAGASAGSSGQ